MQAMTSAVCLALVLTAGTASAQSAKRPSSTVSVTGDFLTLGHYRTDSDFDPSDRYYDKDGQTEGQVATFFSPGLTIRAGNSVTVYYRLEMGWNAWSRNDPGQPNQFLPSNQAGLGIRHKEIWGEWRNDVLSVRAGMQHFADPSRLFLDHWAGLLSAELNVFGSKMGLFVGQLPDTTYEGVSIRDDNFLTDSVIGGFTYERKLRSTGLTLDVALYGLHDRRSIERPLNLCVAMTGLRYEGRNLKAWLQLVGQTGAWDNSGLAGVDQSIKAWAAQLGVMQRVGAFHWSTNVYALSADDEGHGNEHLGTFFGSGKNYSRSVLLTEDEDRDRYDNLDERVASQWGAFVTNRAGLVVSDVAFGYNVGTWYQPVLVAAGGFNLNPDNAFGHRYLGTEISLLQDFTLNEYASFFLNANVFLPGKAASVFVNDVDRDATETVLGAQLGFRAQF